MNKRKVIFLNGIQIQFLKPKQEQASCMKYKLQTKLKKQLFGSQCWEQKIAKHWRTLFINFSWKFKGFSEVSSWIKQLLIFKVSFFLEKDLLWWSPSSTFNFNSCFKESKTLQLRQKFISCFTCKCLIHYTSMTCTLKFLRTTHRG